MDIKQKCGYILYFGKARKKLETRYRKAQPAQGPIHKSPSPPEARKIQARNITISNLPWPPSYYVVFLSTYLQLVTRVRVNCSALKGALDRFQDLCPKLLLNFGYKNY